MSTELVLLGWTLVLAIVQIMLHASLRNRETGIDYNASARDEPAPPPGKVTARLERAKLNLFETLPLFIGAVLATHVAGVTGTLTWWGCWLYFGARVVYVPLYAFGVPVVRSLVWLVSMAGLAMVLFALLRAA
ncbi:MAPEG family protein [Massilia sp. METH4]|uniref:MAPEG family protein n=1 Tax=Massilia sp. METH4 TaxID=3123041 RepID=UPI0030D3BC7B